MFNHSAHGWWLEEAGRVAPRPTMPDGLRADVAIVGGGFAGLWTAWHLLAAEPDLRIAILEAKLCGHGPSGRNGGFCESLWRAVPRLRELFGDQAARELADASSASVVEIGQWCADEGVDAWFRHDGAMMVASSQAQEGRGDSAVAAAAAIGAPERVVTLSAAEVQRRCASPVFGSGIFVPDYATVQPARLALGLRSRLIERGVQIYEHSPVRKILRRPEGGVTLLGETDTAVAERAVVTVNASATTVTPVKGRVSATSAHIMLTEPVPDVLDELGWRGGEGITDLRVLVHFIRPTKDDRIAFGWGGGRLAYGARLGGTIEVAPKTIEIMRGHMLRMFPMLAGREITHAWGGPVDITPTRTPQIDEFHGGRVFGVFGFSGNGVGPSHMTGKALAALARDRRDEFSRLPIVGARHRGFPVAPLAWAGGSAVRAAIARQEDREDGALRPSATLRAVANAPSLLGISTTRQ